MHSQAQNILPNTPKNTNNKAGLAIINSKAPYSSHFGKDALDVALIFGSYEQKVSLFFQGDGVYQLIARQDTSLLSIKDYLKTFAAFEFYDIEHIYACQQSLLNRKLEPSFHITDVQVLASTEFSAALDQHQHVLRF
jgi:tRNA 2-thiouridine synthesizing protein C